MRQICFLQVCRRALMMLALVAQFAPAHAGPADKAPVIFAAASMKTALDAIAQSWGDKTGKAPVISYGSSGTLAKQIEEGAPADVFISADLVWMDELDKKGLLRKGTRINLVGNTLVLVEPADATAQLKLAPKVGLAAAVGDGKIAVCTIASCPAGIYGKEALEHLGIWAEVEPKLAQTDNVRAALNLVARGEAKFGIVYATDAKAEPKVKVVDTFAESTHTRIAYPAAVIDTSKNNDAAAFLSFMRAQNATRILTEQGFSIIAK